MDIETELKVMEEIERNRLSKLNDLMQDSNISESTKKELKIEKYGSQRALDTVLTLKLRYEQSLNELNIDIEKPITLEDWE